ncbi:MAG: carbamoyl phosphate synthase small subunit [Chloroflexi bacterium]|nr:carbamoyl phosphate synthase small subunit [Chloroflexota bacterium]
MPRGYLVLSDGSIYKGDSYGAEGTAYGEVVFNTSMSGYQEILTDPSYAGQIVIPTYPLQGNYGVNESYEESYKIQVASFVIRNHSQNPSHFDVQSTLSEYLKDNGIPGLSGVDTRAITRRIRSEGVMMGAVTNSDPQMALEELMKRPVYDSINFVEHVTTKNKYVWNANGDVNIALVDCGVKFNILRNLANRNCRVQVFPASVSAETILNTNPDGVVFSPGPGDPVHNEGTVATARSVLQKIPTLGICLGHQIIARALGANTYKLKFGHRGGNHPVQDLSSGKVYITAQNHGYAVVEEDLPAGLIVTHKNLHDGTIEGIRHQDLPIISIQYHSEAAPGPLDNEYIFDQFLELVTR